MKPKTEGKTRVDWYTPIEVVEAARKVSGGFDLDPASCADANAIVKASRFFTEADDGLRQHWNGRVFLNPPGGSVRDNGKPRSLAAIWWAKLISEIEAGRVTEAFFVCFNLELLRHAQNEAELHPLDFDVCFPRKRLRFWTVENGAKVEAKSPEHANVIVYLGTNGDRFGAFFHTFGKVISQEWQSEAAARCDS